ncbi:hypothetical protein RclHR1_00330003 [Rhizophagus clarus]|uniref:BTB domain-containing protein n=1 Tax=Rhizophagus clarus TaxID=94130 RepID=A0A2Z6S2Y5_9GLOM|nr:hypothetical protein RclHR1_00330003 [Rhizophagus clarus]GES81760.1 hypothetical protein GLOIN_2v1778254 [Rhizophagus clarus]
MLRARSSYFKSALSPEWITKKDDMIMFNKPNITPTVFDMILRYIYTGELNLGKYSGENVLRLLITSDELILEELFEHVQDYLIKKRTTWIQENFVLVLHTVSRLTSCKKLHDYCLESICEDPRPFFTSKNFPLLDKEILYGLLKRDDMLIDEVVVWECLIKWGIEQTPGLGNIDNAIRIQWNKSNYEALKKTLNQFIPLIRFVEISPSEYFDKVRPYKAIIPNHIYEEVEEFYFKGTLPKTTTLPPRVGKFRIDSIIIKPKLISIITNWINKRNAKASLNKDDLNYKFNLIYRGDRDGINNNSFKNKCELEEFILVLVKCQDSRKIFGGYTPVGFCEDYNDTEMPYTPYNYRNLRNRFSGISSYMPNLSSYGSSYDNHFIYSQDSFIFSFEGNDDDQNMKICRVTSYDNAIYNNYPNIYGFCFGDEDLCMQDNNLYVSDSGYYENNFNCNDAYVIEEIEAFKVEKQ